MEIIKSKYKSLKIKVFDYFYYMIINKTQTSFYTLIFSHIIETVQLISFAFSSPHLLTWKLSKKSIKIINLITSGFRLTPLLNLVSFREYQILFIVFILIILLYFIILLLNLLNGNQNSKFYSRISEIVLVSIAPITIILYIPIIELFLISLKCNNNKSFNESFVECWSPAHLLLVTFGIIFSLVYSIILLFLNGYYFYPFQSLLTTIKLNPVIDIFLLIIKYIFELEFILIKNEYISIAILLILSFFLFYQKFTTKTYNINSLELIINLRNILMLWTFFMLFIAKLSMNTKINNLIYLLVFGYPIVIFSFIMFFNEHETKFDYNNSSLNNINSCLSRITFLIQLINSFFDEQKNSFNFKYGEKGNQKNDILLKGFIQIHTETCIKEDCPLTKFLNNNGNYNIQKQCLLNYMTNFFNDVIKKFPNSILLRLYYINFNYQKKYNLNSVRANLEEIKKMKYSFNEEFLIYILEKEIIKMKINDVNDANELEKENIIVEQNYKKLKDLISNCTKLYVEFWEIFATNITNSLNSLKLYKLGEKLNIILKDINYLWENKLKNKKIEYENENNAQLYSRFLRDILWDKKKSELVMKKISEDHNIQMITNKIIEDKTIADNIDNIMDSQDYSIFVTSNDKGKCNIIQFSNSLAYLIGYQKYEVINKPLEFLMPSIFIDGHSKKVEEYIKTFHFQKHSDKDSFREIDKKRNFILIKNKMGYLVPFNAQHSIFDDNDFSNSFVIKSKLEPLDAKSTYAYYILTKPDFSVENISSSAIHLGFTLDLLKKYVIKLNILVRNSKNNVLNLLERYKEYEEDTKKVTWIYPDIIYPKNDVLKNKDTPIYDLIKISNKKKFNLQIFEIKYKEDEILGFVFKFTELKKKKKNETDEITPEKMIPPFKNEILFDLMNLNYIRTIVVKKKSGLRNLREKIIEGNRNDLTLNTTDKKKRNKTKEEHSNNEINEISSEEEEKVEIMLTKDRILELQTRDSNGIKSFINSLPFYGSDISLIKHRPNKEKYPSGHIQEPLIKIDLSKYTKRIESKIRENPEFFRKFKNRQTEEKNNDINNNNSLKTQFTVSETKANENNSKETEGTYKEISNNNSFSLINIFDVKSIKLIKYSDYFVYLLVSALAVFEFISNFLFLKSNNTRYAYLKNSYKLLNDLAYTKYFITEAILYNNIPDYLFLNQLDIDSETFFSFIKEELSSYRQDLSETINHFTNPNIGFSEEFKNYISKTNVTIKTLINGFEKEEIQPFLSAVNKLTTSIFYLSIITDNSQIDMNNTYSYELMANLLNSYYIVFENLIFIVFKDFQNFTQLHGIRNLIFFCISLFSTILTVFIFWKMANKLNNDREKPINLFLTIKKKIFEDLKNSEENFSNKLLNKFFGVDENEEESQQEYRTNIKPNDVNIAKFKALNEYKSFNKKSNFGIYYFQLILFFLAFNGYLLFKYLKMNLYQNHMDNFLVVFNTTQFSQIFLITRIDNIKQYLYNTSILIYNNKKENMLNHFLEVFLTLSQEFQNSLKQVSKTDCFLKDEYRDTFIKYAYGNYSELIKINNNQNYTVDIKKKSELGFKSLNLEIFDILRFIVEKYFIDSERDNPKNISLLLNYDSWTLIHSYLVDLVRPWYRTINSLLNEAFYNYIGQIMKLFIIIFIIFLLIENLFFWLLWKSNEKYFIDSIKKSFDLINLIPEEIKNIIVNKLNE